MAADATNGGGPWPAALAVGVPLACWLATASGHGHWLDGGELVAQAADFGISHPPGHPLFGVLATGFAWLLPVGSLAFRVALLSALTAAGATYCVFRAARATFVATGVTGAAASTLAVASTWLACGSYAWWLQAVRPEVYALQALLVCFAIERLVALEAAWPTADLRPLYQASVALGLALANHHFLALLLLPAGAATLARAVAARGPRPVWLGAGLVASGVLLYLYLPLRAERAALALGHPNSASRLWWVVSAEAFQKNQGEGVPGTLGDRLVDVFVHLAENLHVATLVIALGGAYFLLRRPAGRRIGVLWLLVLLVFAGARAWLGFVRHNPDALGYLLPAFAAASVLAGAFVATLASLAGPRVAFGLALLGLGAAAIPPLERGPEASLAGFRDTDLFDDPIRRELPTRAVVLVHDPSTVFRHWESAIVEGARPDVAFVPVPFLTYPEMVDDLVVRHPDLRALLRAYLLEGQFDVAALQTLAAERPTLVELDLRVPIELYETLAPAGFHHRVVPAGATETDIREGLRDQEARWSELERLLGAPKDPETRRRVLWHTYVAALYAAEVGERDAARALLARGLAIEPDEPPLRGLAAALEEGEGRVDTRPFRVD